MGLGLKAFALFSAFSVLVVVQASPARAEADAVTEAAMDVEACGQA